MPPPASLLKRTARLPGGEYLALALAIAFLTASALIAGTVVNRDGILYLDTAQAYLHGGLGAAIQSYPWPAYAIFIAETARLTGLGLQGAAHLLDALCLFLLGAAFIRLCKQVDGERPRGWLALGVLLAFAPLTKHLHMQIFRDWGYLAFALASFTFLLRFWLAPKGRFSHALAWQGLIGLSCLFRIEAVALMVLAPLGLLWGPYPWRMRLIRWGQANLWLAPALMGALALTATGALPASRLQDILLYGNPLAVWEHFSNQAALFSGAVLNKYSRDAAAIILGSGLVTMTAYMTLANLSGGLLAIGALGLLERRPCRTPAAPLVGWLLAINTLVLVVFLATTPVTVNRYALLSSLLLLVLLLPAIGRMLDDPAPPFRSPLQKRLCQGFIRLVLALLVVSNLIVLPDSKLFLAEAGRWVAALPTGTRVITNDTRIQYYGGLPRGPGLAPREVDEILAALAANPAPGYLALHLDDAAIRALAPRLHCLAPQARFHSRRGQDHVQIYAIPAQSANPPCE